MFSEEFGDLCRPILAKQNGNITSEGDCYAQNHDRTILCNFNMVDCSLWISRIQIVASISLWSETCQNPQKVILV